MSVATRGTASNYLQRAPSPSGLVDVVDLILDKGLVVDTYIRFAEAVNRLDLTQTEAAGLKELREGGGDHDKGKGMVEGAKEAFSRDDDKERQTSKKD